MTTQNDENSAPAISPPQNKRLAPRSSNQFRIGPPFAATVQKLPIYDSTNELVVPTICARLDRGFNLIDNEWIGYKRNYFTLVASFFFADRPLNIAATDSFWILDTDRRKRTLKAFKIMLTSVCPEDNASAVTLVQHTAKRDRGPQNSPPVYYAVPGQLPPHLTMKSVANIRNGDKIDRCNRLFYLSQEEVSQIAHACPSSILAQYPADRRVSLVSRYERIQFSSAGCGNRKSASTNNKHYILVVQLLGEDTTGNDVVLAYSESPPLVVRGRSPSNYPSVSTTVVETKEFPNRQFDGSQEPPAQAFSDKKQSLVEKSHLEVAANCRRQAEAKMVMNTCRTPEEEIIRPKRPKPSDSTKHLPLPSIHSITTLNAWDALDPQLVLDSAAPKNLPDWAIPEQQSPSFYLGEEDLFPADMAANSELEGSAEIPDFWNTVQPFSSRDPHILPQHGAVTGAVTPADFPRAYDSPQSSKDFLAFSQDTPLLNEPVPDQNSSYYPDMDPENMPYINSFSTYQALPVPIMSEPFFTSTPLQLKIESRMQDEIGRFRCSQVPWLNPDVKRCRHGFKARVKKPAPQLYSIEDLHADCVQDAAFAHFKSKLEVFRPAARAEPENYGSPLISTLTTISSE